MNQIELHKKIDDLLLAGIATAGAEDIRLIIRANDDAQRYFFARADESWLSWLWDHNFFAQIKKKAEDPTSYSYRTPELDYLVRMSEKVPNEVVNIILQIPISANIFNPEVVDRFLWICSKLIAPELSRVVRKIRDDRWAQLMGPFNRWGFEYQKMFETLAEANDYESIILLSEAVLVVRTTADVKKTSYGSLENPFYFNDLHQTEVFNRLARVDDEHAGTALTLVSKTFGEVVKLGDKEEGGEFEFKETFHLFDVDFFTVDLNADRHFSARDDVRDLAATVTTLTRRVMEKVTDNPETVRDMYNIYFAALPESRTTWRLHLFVWSLYPEVFKTELKQAFFRIFDAKNPWEIAGGAEYEQALRNVFRVLAEDDKRTYVKGVLERFGGKEDRPGYGFDILSTIFKDLTEEERTEAQKVFSRPLNPDHIPEPSVGRSYAGTVVPQAPPDTEDFWEKPVPEIVEILKSKWTPEALHKMDKKQDFLRPISAEGVADKLRDNLKQRLQEYVNNAPLFFDRENLDAHYTYSFLRGIQEVVKADYEKASSIDWSQLVLLGKTIAESGSKEPFDHKKREREQFDSWLSGWTGVHSNLADVITELFRDNEGKAVVDFDTHRNDLFIIVSYLLSHPDPRPADENGETAILKHKSPGEEEYEASDPYSIAINTARGRAFETFLQFVYQDGKKFPKESKSKLSKDVQQLYEKVLRGEDTRAIMFMFGHYLAFFYFRDSVWMETLSPTIFSKDPARVDLYFAAWEGYLTSSLYTNLFGKLHDEYSRAIAIDPAAYTKRRYRGNLDEALATHLALAYLHLEGFGFDSDLYKSFWNTPNTKRHSSFVSFIGRHVISRDRPEEWLKENEEVSIKKLEAFWDWALEHCNDKETLEEFGFWMQVKYKIFDPIWLAERIDRTLEKTGGDIGWEIGFVDSLLILAKAAPEKTLSALRSHLIDGSILKKARGYIRVDSNLKEVLSILYANESTRDGTYKLINDLLPIGGGQFWPLKEILSS